MKIGTAVLVAACVCACAAEKWQWPEGAASVRIDTKVRFIDDEPRRDHKSNRNDHQIQADEPQFSEPSNTEGFYNRPPGVGRYPVRVEPHRAPYRVNSQGVYPIRKGEEYYSDGTLDSLQYCKCVSTPECSPSVDSVKACGVGKYLCCYKRANKNNLQNTEYFNEVEDERPELLPGQGGKAGPFPPAPDIAFNGGFGPGQAQGSAHLGPVPQQVPPVLVGPGGPTGVVGPGQNRGVLVGPGGTTGMIDPGQNRGIYDGQQGPGQNPGVLVGPGGPTGIIGPGQNRGIYDGQQGPGQNPGVLVGPGGPTGIIGPGLNRGIYDGQQGPGQNRGVLVGPGGPTGIIGPAQQNKGVLVGPGGPTGVIGPSLENNHFLESQDEGESAQRGVLVGPGGPTGFIGPAGFGRRPVLVGPGGPTGIIGPYGRQGPSVLVGPGGPTGMIGPPRRRPYYYGK